MKRIRRINKAIAVILALTLVLGMSTMVSATPPEQDTESVTITKEIIVEDGIVHPEETFTFDISKVGFVGTGAFPEFDTDPETEGDQSSFTITVAQDGKTGDKVLDLPTFDSVGVYTYKIQERGSNTAGMTYDITEKLLKITVINNPNFGEEGEPAFLRILTVTGHTVPEVPNDGQGEPFKVDTIKNEFDAGDLTVTKSLEGNFVDLDDEFTVTVVVTPAESKVIKAESIVWNTPVANVTFNAETREYTAVYTLKGNESFTIENLPYDVTYTVEESGFGAPTYSPPYIPRYSVDGVIAMDSSDERVTITNTRNAEVDTGIFLDNLPYVMIILVAAGGLVGFTVRKRRINEQ